ncbi:hypothetical protein ZHAS_00003396 [Anopheles sinensis]|uniref:Uncharacterized protein n=1 Tax=Anopheles sinensis TaxID=74873 RepID=A0A084VE83_ANOSI|nr:hypothetical protein ZHAS_00003396 [Anopheles sinensis]
MCRSVLLTGGRVCSALNIEPNPVYQLPPATTRLSDVSGLQVAVLGWKISSGTSRE